VPQEIFYTLVELNLFKSYIVFLAVGLFLWENGYSQKRVEWECMEDVRGINGNRKNMLDY